MIDLEYGSSWWRSDILFDIRSVNKGQIYCSSHIRRGQDQHVGISESKNQNGNFKFDEE